MAVAAAAVVVQVAAFVIVAVRCGCPSAIQVALMVTVQVAAVV